MGKGDLIEVKYDEAKLKAVERRVRGIPGAMKRIMPKAINRTAITARARIARKLVANTKFKVSKVKKGIRIIKATIALWESTIILTGEAIPLIQFGARGSKRRGVSYIISERQGRKRLPHAFIRTMPTRGDTQKQGHRGVFMRKGSAKFSEGFDSKGRPRKGRLPIRERFGPSIGIVFEQASGIAAETVADTGVELQKNIDSHVAYVLSRARGAA